MLLFTTFFMFVSLQQNRVLPVPTSMNAIVIRFFGKPDALKVENVKVPEFSSSQVLVNVKAAGINPIDTYVRAGTNAILPPFPIILGKEIAGVIEEIGDNVTRFQKGTRVFCGIENGGYAEYAVANSSNCFPLPVMLTYEQGAALYVCYFTAHRAVVFRGQVKEGDVVLIHGASGIFGVAAVQVAKAVGAVVVASVKAFDVERLMSGAGADYIIYHDQKSDQYLSDVLIKLGKSGFDVILEILGDPNIQRDKKFTVNFGRIVILGNRITVDAINKRSKWTGEPRVYAVSFFRFTEEQQQDAGNFLLKATEEGFINPVIGYEYKLSEAARAHVDIFYNQASKGKPVFII